MFDVIQLNFINRSADTNNTSYVIFQKNVATDTAELAIAWTVIENLGVGDNHPFAYPMHITVGAEDSYGNFTPQLAATYGDAFEMVKDDSGDVFREASPPATSPNELEVRNNLPQGAINALIYRDGRVCFRKTDIAPGEKAVFSASKPILYVGAASQITQGQVMDSAVISEMNTELDLFGIQSADIVVTGGGSGPNAEPFTFQLENIT